MSQEDWFTANAAGLHERLAFLARLPDGAIHQRPGSMHNLVVWKAGTFLELHFLGGTVKTASREIISDLDFSRPLHLFAGFTQAMMLGLLWVPRPQLVYVLGFGAGRVPMILHHHFPEVRVESTDIDPDVVEVASKFFGIVTDERQKVIVQDGRQYLARRRTGTPYDIIMVDAFRGVGFSPVALGTKEFYSLCREHLTEGGVVVVNLMRTDFMFKDKVRTLLDSFPHVYCVPIPKDGTVVFFASRAAESGPGDFLNRAQAIQEEHHFESPFVEHAERLIRAADSPDIISFLPSAKVLHDSIPSLTIPLPEQAKARAGRNDPCPCGSGLKYKKCHGAPGKQTTS